MFWLSHISKKKMIISELNGGLGNQLFQFAIARNLSIKLNIPFKLDASIYNNNKVRQYNLDVFGCKNSLADKTDISFFFPNRAKGIARILQTLKNKYYRPVVIEEQNFKFNADVLGYTNNKIYLKGYWQSEKYFNDIRLILLNDLKITMPLKKSNEVLLEKIQSKKSVALHIRRGDYVSNKTVANYHGTCSLDYYYNAINYIAQSNEEIVIYVFSDDIDWVKANLKTKHTICYVENNMNYEDLRLMSSCHHNIIANSSFSWWGAWLNQSSGKVVIAPKNWFINTEINTIDLLPETWIKL